MSHKKKLLFLLLFLGIGIVFDSCQHEETMQQEEVVINIAPKFHMRVIEKNELQDNKGLVQQLEKITRRSAIAESSESGFDIANINVDQSKYIESIDGSFHSYTFLVENNYENDGIIQNLVFSLQSDGSYKADLIQYTFIADEQVEIKYAPIDVDSSLFLGAELDLTWTCVTTVYYTQTWNNGCECQYIQIISTSTDCSYTLLPELVDVQGNGSGGAWDYTVWVATGGGNTSSSGNSYNPDDDVVTSPFFDLNEEKNKRKLRRMSNDPKIKAMLEDLRTKALNENHLEEGGAIYKKKSDGTYEERLPQVVQGTVTEFFPEFTSGESVAVHMHSQKAWDYTEAPPVLGEVAPIPSKVDVFKFLGFMFHRDYDTTEPSHVDDDDEIVSILVTDVGTFALTVGDTTKMLAADTAISSQNSDDDIIQEFLEEYNTDVLDECSDDACRVREFIKFIKTHTINGNTLGIDMYQAIIVNNEITGWRKL